MTERKQGDQSDGAGSAVVTKTQRPSLYRVLILNDDYTPMEFVVYVLERFFNKSREEATRIMLHVHQHGVGVCGVFTYEVAETKVAQVIDTARGISTRCSAPWKRIEGLPCRLSRAIWKKPCIAPWRYANQRKHEYATLEHLLLSLTDDEDAAAVMRACNVDLAALKKSLVNYLDVELKPRWSSTTSEDAKPTAGFQRVIQRAVIHVQSSGRDEVTGANVLVAIFSERESHAAYFLQEQDMTRYDAVNFIAHGIAKKAGASEPKPVKGAAPRSRRKARPRPAARRSRPIASTSTRRPARARSTR
jgi:ATP-dependent Clp protease adapter protein ClpS